MHRLCSPALVLVLGLAACGPSPDPTDAGADAALATDAPEAIDAGCPDRVTAVLGPAGGELVHCEGGRLVVAPGVLSAEREFELDRLRDVPAPPAPVVLAGPAYRFGPAANDVPVTIELPHGGAMPVELAALAGTTWETFEACEVTETTISQTVVALGTFGALHDPTPSPASREGLGSGSIDFTFGGTAGTLDVDPAGYAIDETAGPERNLSIVFRRSDATGLVQVELRLGIDAAGTVSPFAVIHSDTAAGEIWTADVILSPGDLAIDLTSDDGTAIAGTVTATLHLGDATRALTGTFSASTEFFRYPPERVCP